MRFQNILRIVKNLFMGKTLKYPSFSLFPPNAFYVPKCQDQAPFKQLYVPIPLIYPTFIINQKNIPRLNEVNNSSLCQSAIHIIYRWYEISLTDIKPACAVYKYSTRFQQSKPICEQLQLQPPSCCQLIQLSSIAKDRNAQKWCTCTWSFVMEFSRSMSKSRRSRVSQPHCSYLNICFKDPSWVHSASINTWN